MIYGSWDMVGDRHTDRKHDIEVGAPPENLLS